MLNYPKIGKLYRLSTPATHRLQLWRVSHTALTLFRKEDNKPRRVYPYGNEAPVIVMPISKIGFTASALKYPGCQGGVNLATCVIMIPPFLTTFVFLSTLTTISHGAGKTHSSGHSYPVTNSLVKSLASYRLFIFLVFRHCSMDRINNLLLVLLDILARTPILEHVLDICFHHTRL